MNPSLRRLGLGLILGCAAWLQGASGPTLDVLGQLRLGVPRKVAETSRLDIGHAKVGFSGTWAPLTAGETVVGMYLEGNGGLEYVSDYEPEGSVFARNAKDWVKLDATPAGKGKLVSCGFQRARIFWIGVPSPAWAGDPASQGPFQESYRAFQERWEKVDGHAPAPLVAACLGSSVPKSVVVIELDGRDQSLIYRYDPVEGFEESLVALRPMKEASGTLRGWNGLIPLSRQPLGWDPRKGQAPARMLMTGLDVDLRTEDNRNAKIAAQITLVPLLAGQSVLTFELQSEVNLDTEVRHLKVTQVLDAQGRPCAFLHTHDHLAIALAEPAPPGQPLRLSVAYEGDFLVSPGNDNYWQLGVRGAWYPQPRHMSEENYLFHATVRTRGEWLAFMPGDTVRREKEGPWNLVETRTALPICFATILGGKYFVDEESRDGITLRVASYGVQGGYAIKVIKDQAFNILSYYKQFLGPYPFKDLTIIEKNEWGYGQAPPSMTYITREAFEQISNLRQMQEIADMVGRYGGRLDFRTMDVRHVLAHELAHQYWGTVVKMPTPEDQWITESFADYCAALYDRDFKGEGRYRRNVAGWRSSAEEAKDAAPIPLANEVRRKDGYEAFKMRTGLLYAKGPMLLASLHQELGEQVFLTWLKSIQTNFKWKFAPTWRIFDLLGYITKKDQKAFYETYFWGTGMPPVK